MIDSDLAYLRLAEADLQEYLLSGELFWPLASIPHSIGVPGLNQLSLGGLALAIKRIGAGGEPSADTAALLGLVEQVKARWRSNWSRKAAREFQSRVGLWQRNLGELIQDPAANAKSYPAQVRLRVILELLKDESSELTEVEWGLLSGLDARLKAVSRPSGFIWEPELERGFSPERFWFLYCTLGS